MKPGGAERVLRALQAPGTPEELSGQDQATAAFREAAERRRAARGVLGGLPAFPEPRPLPARPRARRPRLRTLALAGPLTAAASVVAVAALAVPVLTGMFGDGPGTTAVRGPGTDGQATDPTLDGVPATTVRPSASAPTGPARATETGRATATGRRSPAGHAGTLGVTPGPLPPTTGAESAGAGPSRTGVPAPTAKPHSDRATQCRTWLLVRPTTPIGEQLLQSLSTRPRKGRAADVAAVDHLCRGLVGQDPPRCRADGSIDPSVLREGRSAWRQIELYPSWCRAVTGNLTARCAVRGDCPDPWWRCPSWGCESVRAASATRKGDHGKDRRKDDRTKAATTVGR